MTDRTPTADPDTVTIPRWLYDDLVRDASAYRAMQPRHPEAPGPASPTDGAYWWRDTATAQWMPVSRTR